MDLTNFKEEWKYTNISSVLDKAYVAASAEVHAADLEGMRLPGSHKANELVFVNGRYAPALSTVLSPETELVVIPMREALLGEHQDLVAKHLNSSSGYIKDGVQAMNSSMMEEGLFIYVPKGVVPQHPVYMYHVLDGRQAPVMAQPRNLVYVSESARLQLTETYRTLGVCDSFCNEVMELVVAQDAYVEHYKLQNDGPQASQVSTTHISQIGRSYVHTVVITLSGGIIRNNANLVLDAANNEAHMYGLYLLKGKTHVDNHTLIDNKQPGCFSNQLYKGIVDDASTAVFNGRIMVQPDAQKTNAYQSNKNILLSDNATVNAKPQLEIFADDVKCSHGCTVGQLDEEALFYLRARGIPKAAAEVLLLQAFAADVIAQIKPMAVRAYAERLIFEHLSIG